MSCKTSNECYRNIEAHLPCSTIVKTSLSFSSLKKYLGNSVGSFQSSNLILFNTIQFSDFSSKIAIFNYEILYNKREICGDPIFQKGSQKVFILFSWNFIYFRFNLMILNAHSVKNGWSRTYVTVVGRASVWCCGWRLHFATFTISS